MTEKDETKNDMGRKEADRQPWSPHIPASPLFLNSADIEKRMAESASQEAQEAQAELDSEEIGEETREAASSCADGKTAATEAGAAAVKTGR